MDFQFIAELPADYEYKIIRVAGQLRVIGIAQDKEPIGFIIEENHRLVVIPNLHGFK